VGHSYSTPSTQSQSSQDKKATAVYTQQRKEAVPAPKRVDVAAKFNQSGQALHKSVVSLMESTQDLADLNRKDAELQARIAAAEADKAKLAKLQQLMASRLSSKAKAST